MRTPIPPRLLPAAAALLLAACAPIPTKTFSLDVPWHWLGSTGHVFHSRVDVPSKYQLTLQEKEARILADCNRFTASVDKSSSGRLWLERMKGTRAMCPPGSRSDEFVGLLGRVARIDEQGPVMRLELDQLADALYFARDPAARFASWKCEGSVSLAVIFIGEQAYGWHGDNVFTLRRAPAASGERYAGDKTMLAVNGDTALLEVDGKPLLADCRRAS